MYESLQDWGHRRSVEAVGTAPRYPLWCRKGAGLAYPTSQHRASKCVLCHCLYTSFVLDRAISVAWAYQGGVVDLYLGGIRFESLPGCPDWPFRSLPRPLQVNVGIVASDTPKPRPSKSLSGHHSWACSHVIQRYITSAVETTSLT